MISKESSCRVFGSTRLARQEGTSGCSPRTQGPPSASASAASLAGWSTATCGHPSGNLTSSWCWSLSLEPSPWSWPPLPPGHTFACHGTGPGAGCSSDTEASPLRIWSRLGFPSYVGCCHRKEASLAKPAHINKWVKYGANLLPKSNRKHEVSFMLTITSSNHNCS